MATNLILLCLPYFNASLLTQVPISKAAVYGVKQIKRFGKLFLTGELARHVEMVAESDPVERLCSLSTIAGVAAWRICAALRRTFAAFAGNGSATVHPVVMINVGRLLFFVLLLLLQVL